MLLIKRLPLSSSRPPPNFCQVDFGLELLDERLERLAAFLDVRAAAIESN